MSTLQKDEDLLDEIRDVMRLQSDVIRCDLMAQSRRPGGRRFGMASLIG